MSRGPGALIAREGRAHETPDGNWGRVVHASLG